ncbi:Gfo/Idh/MocA family oxidoreductase [Streptomycetaceae bacterium NBC_01309]
MPTERTPPGQQVFGLLGATGIAARAVVEPAARTGAARVRAVAAGDPVRARAFAAEHGVPVVHETYADLLADPEITAVYVSLHNSAHAWWAAQAARSGRHVLVEKPACLSLRELHGIRRAAEAGGVRVAEALMTTGVPALARVADLVADFDGPLGELIGIHTHITFTAPTGYRRLPELGGGILLDAAPYWLQAVQVATQPIDSGRVPAGPIAVEVKSEGPDGADEACEAAFEPVPGVQATLSCGFGERHAAGHEFVFARGHARLRGFLRPAAAALPLNLSVVTGGGRHVEAFAPVHYYDAQLLRIARSFAVPPGGGSGHDRGSGHVVDEIGLTRRTSLLEELQRAAYEALLGGTA